ncbi:unnamed protein product [Paramecium primaurelia]|uniref:Uncharacterized protein n=1 Tax=Paramecium primaurelia TaxID=5886 RepID=A0A8S1NGR3_PARPR|nr:unnamed protein product [Paramecium primaurelia]
MIQQYLQYLELVLCVLLVTINFGRDLIEKYQWQTIQVMKPIIINVRKEQKEYDYRIKYEKVNKFEVQEKKDMNNNKNKRVFK